MPAPRTTAAPHLIDAFDDDRTVLGQVVTAAKSNEIPTARDLVSRFGLGQVVVTVDAMYTQYDTAALIATGGGNGVFTLKSNHVTLHR